MARGRREGIVIAGGGLAACLAALAMARHRPEVPLLIVEEAETFGGEGVHHFPLDELGDGGAALVDPVGLERWPGFYVVFPGFSRKLKAEWAGFAAADLHRLMIGTLAAKQYRLGTKVVAVREDALVLDGGEEIRAEGAIDARGAASVSALDLIYRVQLERDLRLKAPHRLDRPVLVDASVDQAGGLRFMQCLPLGEDRLMVADICVSERSQPDDRAGARIDSYLAARGWAKKRSESVLDRNPAAAHGRRLRRLLAVGRGTRRQARPARRLHQSGDGTDHRRCRAHGSAARRAARFFRRRASRR